jgi:hypothetical protein
MSSDPRWIMAYMLLMAALKISNPIEEFILVKIDNFTRGSGHFCLHGFHVEAKADSTLFMFAGDSLLLRCPHNSQPNSLAILF